MLNLSKTRQSKETSKINLFFKQHDESLWILNSLTLLKSVTVALVLQLLARGQHAILVLPYYEIRQCVCHRTVSHIHVTGCDALGWCWRAVCLKENTRNAPVCKVKHQAKATVTLLLPELMLLLLLMFCSCFFPVFIMHELDCGPVIILEVLALQHQTQRLKGGSRQHIQLV